MFLLRGFIQDLVEKTIYKKMYDDFETGNIFT